jgi:hypothetical protein
MLDKLPLEPIRRVLDANAKFYGALGQITQEYWKAIFGIFRDLPVRMGSAAPAAPSAPTRPTNVTAPASASTLVLEAEAGQEAEGVFMVENRLARMVSTAVITSAFSDPSGRALQLPIRVLPGVVTLEPGGRTLVQIIAPIGADLEADVPYRGEVNVPGLSEHGIPVVVRRRAAAEPLAAPAAKKARRATKRPPRKRGSSSRRVTE